MNALRPQGRLVNVGITGVDMKIPPFPLLQERSVSGSQAGSPSDIARMLDFAARKGLKPMVEVFAMKDVNAAVDAQLTSLGYHHVNWDVVATDWDVATTSAEIRDTVYPTADMPKPVKGKKAKKGTPVLPDLSYTYVYRFTPMMERRLEQGGVRLAAYLNTLFAKGLRSSAK